MQAKVCRSKLYDPDCFYEGCQVITPSGKIGTVIKARGMESKRDNNVRIEVRYSDDPRDSVQLQPHLLVRVG